MLLISLLIGYLFGSLPWALIIGKVFYKTDIREHGSGNLGGSNAGRVLGKKVGLLVIILDALKAFFIVAIFSFVKEEYAVLAGLMCAIGHCYPIFANFKGGKAVATTYGYILAISIFITNTFFTLFCIPLIGFLIILKISKYVSLSSMLSLSIAAIIGCFQPNLEVGISLITLVIFIIFRHKKNIIQIKNNTEKKITWM